MTTPRTPHQSVKKSDKSISWDAKTSKQKVLYLWLRIGISGFVGGIVVSTPHTAAGPDHPWGIYVSVAAMFWILLPLGIWAGLKWGSAIGNEILVARSPAPSPFEIAQQLEAEWGRPATIEEVAAVHQMLSSRRNEALVNAGIGLGTIFAVKHTLRNKREGRR